MQLGGRLLQQAAAPVRLLAQLGAHLAGLVRVGARRVGGSRAPDQGAHAHQVDDAGEAVLAPDRQLDHQGYDAEPLAQRGDGGVEVGARPVHLVDERDPRDAVPVRLPPHRLALRLDAGDGVEHGDGAVQHAQGALHFVGEVDVARRVDQVDPPAVPGAADRGGEDGDAAVTLLRVEVGDRGALVDLAALVHGAGGEQDPLGDGGLARVHVGEDAEVADGGEGGTGEGGGGEGSSAGAHGPGLSVRGNSGLRDSRTWGERSFPGPSRLRPCRAMGHGGGVEAGGDAMNARPREPDDRGNPENSRAVRGSGEFGGFSGFGSTSQADGAGRAAGTARSGTPGSRRTGTGERRRWCADGTCPVPLSLRCRSDSPSTRRRARQVVVVGAHCECSEGCGAGHRIYFRGGDSTAPSVSAGACTTYSATEGSGGAARAVGARTRGRRCRTAGGGRARGRPSGPSGPSGPGGRDWPARLSGRLR